MLKLTRAAVLLALGGLGAARLPAQQFDVASVRPDKSGAPRSGFSPQGNRLTATNVSLFALNPVGTRGTFIGRAVSVQTMAKDLSGVLGRPVLDKTMLRGEYDFDLTWTPDETFFRGPGDPDAAPADPNGPSIFTALQEQLASP
jgi:Protein of unknown function (DUF3738)